MATKSRTHSPVLAFAVYFLSLSIFFGAAAVVLTNLGSVHLDYKQTGTYRYGAVTSLLEAGFRYTAGIGADGTEFDVHTGAAERAREAFAGEGGNIAYLLAGRGMETLSSGTIAQTPEVFIAQIEAGMDQSRRQFNPISFPSSSQGYDHLLVIRGNQFYERQNNRTGLVKRDAPFTMTYYASQMDPGMLAAIGGLGSEDSVICLAVKAEGAFENNYGQIYNAYYMWYQRIAALGIVAGAGMVSLLVWLLVRLNRQGLAAAKVKLAEITGWFWVECKAAAVFIGFVLIFVALDAGYYDTAAGVIAGFCVFWLFWLLVNDLRYGGRDVFHHNIPGTVRRMLLRLESRYPFCARMKRRLVYLILSGILLAVLSLLLVLLFWEMGVFLSVILAAAGVVMLVCYVRYYFRDVDAFAKIIGYVAQIRAGTAAEPLRFPPDSAFAPLAADLNDIHSGMTRMVDERVRSERMKVELITNVSHDLKTPLTSIINYADLLGKETLSPDYANDYVRVLAGKAERLKNLVQDLFEISKANSGAIDLNLEQLCIQSLVEQTAAELDQRTAEAGVEVKLQLCEAPLTVRADGKKLHRVFENLLGNAVKYSLSGTRVYIVVSREADEAQIAFKNVAGYEMTFTADEIVERFRRGDASRTTEGSGLGLAIAKSFLELNGGSLRIELDGDLFKAIVRIPLYVPYAERGAAGSVREPASQPVLEIAEESAAEGAPGQAKEEPREIPADQMAGEESN